ncbi:MAG: protein kinase [Deltaproteobacteria bacterium]|nr:protein kinase [Deltaproteobacteria bacterium]
MATMYQDQERILDRYVVEEFVGSGGLGEVYRCREGADRFAVKVLIGRVVPGYVTDEKIRESVVVNRPPAEALVAVRDVLEGGGRRVIVSDFVDGLDLRRVMKARVAAGKRFAAREIFLLVDALLEELALLPPFAAHGALKPENILLPGVTGDEWPEHPSVRITDYGLHSIISFSKYASLQLAARLPYAYLAPEFVSLGGRVDRRADLYSIGVLAYELATGDVPKKFAGPLSESGWDGPLALDPVIARALAATPEARYTNAAEFRTAIRAAFPELERTAGARPIEIGSIDLFSGQTTQSVSVAVEDLNEVDVFGEAAESAAPAPAPETAAAADHDLVDLDRAFDAALSGEPEASPSVEAAAAAAESLSDATPPEEMEERVKPQPNLRMKRLAEPKPSNGFVWILVALAAIAIAIVGYKYFQSRMGHGTAPAPVATPTPAPTTTTTSTTTTTTTTTMAPTPSDAPAIISGEKKSPPPAATPKPTPKATPKPKPATTTQPPTTTIAPATTVAPTTTVPPEPSTPGLEIGPVESVPEGE